MKIYEIGTGYTPIPAQMGAATEIVVEELTRSFLNLEQDVQILDIKAKERPQTDLPIEEVKVPGMFTKNDVSLGVVHKLKRVVYSISLARKLKKILKAAKEPVVLHFHNQYNLFFFLKLTSKKLRQKATIAYTVHSYIWHGDWKEIEDTVKTRYFQEVVCLENADRIFVLNQHTKENIINHLKVEKEKTVLIDNGVNTQVYSVLSEDEKRAAKTKFSVEDKTVFVQVGSVCDRKNQMESVKLLLPLLKQNKDIVFCYAGGIIDEGYQLALQNFAKENQVDKQVIYAGELQPGETLNLFYNMAEAMIFPSKAEGFSLVVIEAMSAGVPVIINESLEFKLANRCLPFYDTEDFLDLLHENIINKEKQQDLSQQVRQAVLEQYSWDKIASDYLQFIHGQA